MMTFFFPGLEEVTWNLFGAINMRSIFRKHDELMVLLHNSELDLLAVPETWLNSSISSTDLQVVPLILWHPFSADILANFAPTDTICSSVSMN